MLVVEGLAHRFAAQPTGAPPALDIPSLSLAAGELTVITGPSGSGKTTLLYLLSGLLAPSAGRVAWAGSALSSMSETQRDHWRRQHAGIVFQNFNLFEDLSPIDNVVMAAYFAAFSAGTSRRRAASLLERFDVANEKRAVGTYSRGEQQRIALARALLFEPTVLFADEPTASLDVVNAQRLGGLLRELAVEGKCIVAVSHDPQLIGVADRVVPLDHGRLVSGGTQ